MDLSGLWARYEIARNTSTQKVWYSPRIFVAFGRRLFEDDMADFLKEEDCSQAEFVAVLRRAHTEGTPGTESEDAVSNVLTGHSTNSGVQGQL